MSFESSVFENTRNIQFEIKNSIMENLNIKQPFSIFSQIEDNTIDELTSEFIFMNNTFEDIVSVEPEDSVLERSALLISLTQPKTQV